MFDFSGKSVLITGAGAGIGEAAAWAFAQAGASVAVNSVSSSANRVAQALCAQQHRAAFVQGDVSRSNQAESLVRLTISAFGRLDVLVNCAGIVSGGNVEQTDEESWNHTMAVNATGTFLMSKFALPHLRQSKGVIVNVASLVAVKGIASRAAYSASKGAVLSLSKAMAADYLSDGIRVNCICPGTVLSPSLQGRIAAEPDPEAAYQRFVSRQAMGRLGKPEEIAAGILFAASAEAGFMNGANLMLDGAASL